jgi:hypothetical protein
MPYKEWELELTFRVTGARYLGGGTKKKILITTRTTIIKFKK